MPARDAETIANTRAELLAAERLKDLCKQLALAIPAELQAYRAPEAPEYPPPPPPLHFPSHQDKEKQAAQESQQPAAKEEDVKPDVKPPRRLATSYLGKLGWLHMLGIGDEDHFITKVLLGMAPLQDYEEDDSTQIITIDYETNDSDNVDDLSDVYMMSAGGSAKKSSRDCWEISLPYTRS